MQKCSICHEIHGENACPATVTITGLNARQLVDTKNVQVKGPKIPERDAVAFLEEPTDGRQVPISFPTCKVGRNPKCDIVITGEESVSRMHFVIKYEQGKFYIIDENSRNGTYLNGS